MDIKQENQSVIWITDDEMNLLRSGLIYLIQSDSDNSDSDKAHKMIEKLENHLLSNYHKNELDKYRDEIREIQRRR